MIVLAEVGQGHQRSTKEKVRGIQEEASAWTKSEGWLLKPDLVKEGTATCWEEPSVTP